MEQGSVIGLQDYQDRDNLQKSFCKTNEDLISVAFNLYDLSKGKKSVEGEERVFKNKIYIKKGKYWTEKKGSKTLQAHAREAGEHHLKATIEEGNDPLLRKHAHNELSRRQKYEYPKEKKEGK